jgi:sarcosine oxidase
MTYDLVVVGLGAMGSAVLESAARRGLQVLGVEQYAPVHALGSSHGEARMIRKAYFEHAAYVPLLVRAYALWHALEQRSGETIFRRTGVLQVGTERSAIVRGVCASAAQHGLKIEVLDAGAMRHRFPMMRPLDDEVGVFEPEGGVLAPETALRAQLRLAVAAGAHARFGVRAERWSRRGAMLAVELGDGETVTACALALCSGPWLAGELATLGVAIEVRRKVQVWFTPARTAFALGSCPAFLVDRPVLGDLLYGFPDAGKGVKAAFHGGGEPTTPERIDRTPHERDVAPVRAALAAWMPGAAVGVRDAGVCQYDMSPDGHFVLGPHPQDPAVILAGGFSGHGFKFAPLIGEIVTDLAADSATRYDLTLFSPTRFRSPM